MRRHLSRLIELLISPSLPPPGISRKLQLILFIKIFISWSFGSSGFTSRGVVRGCPSPSTLPNDANARASCCPPPPVQVGSISLDFANPTNPILCNNHGPDPPPHFPALPSASPPESLGITQVLICECASPPEYLCLISLRSVALKPHKNHLQFRLCTPLRLSSSPAFASTASSAASVLTLFKKFFPTTLLLISPRRLNFLPTMSGEAWLYLLAVLINAVNLFLQVFFTIMYSDLEW